MLDASVAGLISGGAYALLGVCIVLLFRMVGVLNLAQAAIGVFGAYVMLVYYNWGWPLAIAVIIGIIAGALVGGLLGTVMSRWFAEAPVQTRSSVTIAMLIGLLTIGLRLFGADPRETPLLFTGTTFTVGGVIISLATIIVIVLAVALAVMISLLLQHTHLGVMLRALAEQPTAAELLGVPSHQLTIGVWAFAGAISALAIILIAPTRTPNFAVLSLFILPALGAALLGRFRSFPITIVGGLGIGIFEGIAAQITTLSSYRSGLSFVVILVALLWLQRGEVWDAQR